MCTPDDITNLKEKLGKMDSVDLRTRERANTNWEFYKLKNLTVFAALLGTTQPKAQPKRTSRFNDTAE